MENFHLFFEINDLDKDQTIISFLKKRLKVIPLSLIYKFFRKNKVEVNDCIIIYYQHRLNKGDTIKIFDNYLSKINFSKEDGFSNSKILSDNFNYPLSVNKVYFKSNTG